MRSFRLAAPLLALALVAGCTGDDPTAAPSRSAAPSSPATAALSPSPSPSLPVTPSPVASPSGPACPAAYAAPHADRPVVTLALVVANDHRSVTGSERIIFRPDLPVTEVVLRLWGNGPRSRAAGGRVTVRRVEVAGMRRGPATAYRLSDGDTLLTVPLGPTVPAGTKLTIDVDFAFRLPEDANERYGTDGRTLWLASGQPLLAWERGRGWAREPATAAFAEATTSETFLLGELSVEVPEGDTVLGTGAPVARRNRFVGSAEAVRDLMVAVGKFRLATADAAGVPVRVGVAPGLTDDPARVARLHVASMAFHRERFGPFPYPALDVAMVPDVRGGIEYPGAILLGSGQLDATLTHEVAHEYFYGLVGNNQGRDPWLDEAFATYAEALHRGSGAAYQRRRIPADGRFRVGAPMTYWERHRDSYFRSVYVQGAVMLLEARRLAGPARWDAAIRCYVAANAHRIVTPEDFRRAVAHLPGVVGVLRRYGALPRS